MKVKLRATITFIQEYEADSSNYNNCEFVGDMIIKRHTKSEKFAYYFEKVNGVGFWAQKACTIL
jgi:hypothetical protein